MKTVLIIEDNARSMEMLIRIIKDIDEDINVKCASDVNMAYKLSIENLIDVFLVDIILDPCNQGDVSGVRFADNIRELKRYAYTPIIFVTSLEDPKLYAYSDLRCFQYIEKPYNVERVSRVVRDALHMPIMRESNQNVYFRKEGVLYRKSVSEIIYIENTRRGRVVHGTDGDMELSYKPCKEILEELQSDKFIQCSRYAVINKDFIERIDEVNRFIKLKGRKEQVEIGVVFKKRFMRDVRND